jgi:hypothetical protein
LDAFKEFMFLGEFLGIHVVHHFYVNWERKVIKAFSRESVKTYHLAGKLVEHGEEAAEDWNLRLRMRRQHR